MVYEKRDARQQRLGVVAVSGDDFTWSQEHLHDDRVTSRILHRFGSSLARSDLVKRASCPRTQRVEKR